MNASYLVILFALLAYTSPFPMPYPPSSAISTSLQALQSTRSNVSTEQLPKTSESTVTLQSLIASSLSINSPFTINTKLSIISNSSAGLKISTSFYMFIFFFLTFLSMAIFGLVYFMLKQIQAIPDYISAAFAFLVFLAFYIYLCCSWFI